jgi:hypothetical protein
MAILVPQGPVLSLRQSRDYMDICSIQGSEPGFSAAALSSYAEQLIVSYLCYAFLV